MSHTYFFPMEVFAREYYAKLALGVEIVARGNTAVIGTNHLVRNIALEGAPNSRYYEIKGQAPSGMEYLYELRNRGLVLYGQDEEAGISYANFEDFKRFRPETQKLELYESFFSWGLPDYESLRHSASRGNVLLTGSPRTAFWGEFGEIFFEETTNRIKNTHRRFVLVISNTTIVNSVLNKRETFRVSNHHGYNEDYLNAYEFRKSWERDAYATTIHVINEILNKTDLDVVVRTHPVEDAKNWNRTYGENARVHLSTTGPITPLIFASETVIHAGSTAGLEAIVANKKTISIENLIKTRNFQMNATSMSIRPKNLGSFIESLDDKFPKQLFPSESLERIITNWGTADAIKAQCEHMALGLHTGERFQTPRPVNESLFKQVFVRMRYGRSGILQVHSKKRPEISLDKIKLDAAKLAKNLHLDMEIAVEELGESTFKLSALK